MFQLTLAQALELAVQHHQAGRLPQAESLYRQILAQQPNHVEALHLLGVLATQVGKHDAGLELIDRAIALEPRFYLALCNRGNILRDLKRHDQALASYRQALALKPDSPEVLVSIGSLLFDTDHQDDAIAAFRSAIALNPNLFQAHNNLGNALKDKGQLDEAIAEYRRAVVLNPQSAEARSNLGAALEKKGQNIDAIAVCRQAIAINPNFPEVYTILGKALFGNDQLEPAIAAFRQAIALRPDADMYNNLGTVLIRTGRLDEAIVALRQAIALAPLHADAHGNFGVALKDKGQLEDAIASLRQSRVLDPQSSETLNNLANALSAAGNINEAIATFQQAIALRPDFYEAYTNLAVVLQKAGRVDSAVSAAIQAMAIGSSNIEALNNLGVALKDKGQLDEALAAFRQVLVVKPEDHEAHSNLVFDLLYHPDYDARALAAEAARWNARHAEPLRKFIQPHTNDRTPDRRLRIGYVSPDFREHPVARFLLPLLAHRDRSQFELVGYSQSSKSDAFTHRLAALMDRFHSTVGLPDADFADLIRRDQIDILVDLAMHTAGNRLLVFARKPAPVQVTWLGYPGSTGLTAIDYRLSDPYLDPPGADESVYSETTLRLPDCFWCYQPAIDRPPEVSTLPVLATETITFGCLNNFCKVSAPTLSTWAAILRAVPTATLLLHAREGTHRPHLLERLARENVDPARLRFADFVPTDKYFTQYHHIDIALDTFPYCGGTTSCDALWMGVPVVTLAGQTAVSRGGSSILSNLGLTELIAHSTDEYIRIAASLATDLPSLVALRTSLRTRMEASPLMDAPRFARGVESAYRRIWQHWCATPPPTP